MGRGDCKYRGLSSSLVWTPSQTEKHLSEGQCDVGAGYPREITSSVELRWRQSGRRSSKWWWIRYRQAAESHRSRSKVLGWGHWSLLSVVARNTPSQLLTSILGTFPRCICLQKAAAMADCWKTRSCWCGIQATVITDNRSQFARQEFARLALSLEFKYFTSRLCAEVRQQTKQKWSKRPISSVSWLWKWSGGLWSVAFSQ